MSILLPDFGLLFWMLVAFGIVFFILAKYGFPAITSMIDERKRFIDESLKSAREANERIANIKAEGEAILNAAREEQAKILREAAATREQLIKEAREKAEDEGNKMLQEAKRLIEQEKEEALCEIRNSVAELSLSIAEKILRKELSSDEAQQSYANKMVDEAVAQKADKK
ncbi:MAG: F0F1 ATP synthase subunit B [Bacteroidaceae bacterium]|nr:F0F1 ATP synthase subunit B [Bacteroidaceae bacterium]MBQ8364656.1 F0F1 ATP synthase subunit B [Bacteroidaceae bacterium]